MKTSTQLLKYKADVRALTVIAGLFTVRLLLLITGNYNWIWLFVFICWNYVSLIIIHNHVHNPIFRNKKANRILDYILTILTMGSVSNLYFVHTLNHHFHVDGEKDWFSSKIVNYRWNFLNLIIFPLFAFANAIRYREELFRNKNYRLLNLKKRSENTTIAIFLICIFLINWKTAIVYWIVPGFFGKYFLAATNLIQHDGCDPDSEYNHSRNYTGNLVNWFLFNSGYHSIHHMKPAAHWSVLPQLHKDLIKPRINPELDTPNILVYLFRTYIFPGRRVKSLQQETSNSAML